MTDPYRREALLELLRSYNPALRPRYRSVLPGTWDYHGGREGTKRYLQLAWLAHRMEDAKDSSEVTRKASKPMGWHAFWDRTPKIEPMPIDDQLSLVRAGLERDWRAMWGR